jgi:hypothetical protein
MPKLFIGIVVIVLVAFGGYALTRKQGPPPEPSPEITEETPSPTALPATASPPTDTGAPEATLPPASETPVPTSTGPATEAFSITADDDTYTPSGPIVVTAGSTVTIRFHVSAENVYYGGLEFRGGPVDSGTIKPGGNATVSFTATEDFTITAYWPASGVIKYRIPVIVQES